MEKELLLINTPKLIRLLQEEYRDIVTGVHTSSKVAIGQIGDIQIQIVVEKDTDNFFDTHHNLVNLA